jgi:GxxExxY protein
VDELVDIEIRVNSCNLWIKKKWTKKWTKNIYIMELLYKQEVYTLIGIAMTVHQELGCGFAEPIYEEAFAVELRDNNIPFERQKKLTVFYKGKPLEKYYVADLICYDGVIVELKALSTLISENEAQLLNYLKITKMRVGLLVNFGAKSLQYKRMVL